ncbi:MAG: hypothetical protein CL685_00195 [Candidatus Magasanikbacteria bacterium]|nr:hypothetical protein [Candidatus Magasanikbacteria bacterium]
MDKQRKKLGEPVIFLWSIFSLSSLVVENMKKNTHLVFHFVLMLFTWFYLRFCGKNCVLFGIIF